MIGDGPFQGFKVAPRGVAEIRISANAVRCLLGIGDNPQDTDLGLLLDQLTVKYGITYDVLEADDMPHPDVESCWHPELVTMHIRADVFEKVCRGDPRARFTILHELGHALLGHRRTINRTESATARVFEDSEWQANQFAAEFLMPLEVIRRLELNAAFKIEMHFNVSAPAAQCRLKQLVKRGELLC